MTRGIRIRSVLSAYFQIVVLALIVVAALGGYVTYTAYAVQGTHTETRTVGSWQTSGAYTQGAVVRESNPVYPVGTRLSNQSVYFERIAPVLNGTFTFRYTAASGKLDVTESTAVVLRSVKRDRTGKVTTVYWSKRRSLDQRTASLPSGTSLSVPFEINVSRLTNQTEQIHKRLGNDPGSVEALVTVTVAYKGTVDGHAVSDTRTYPLRVVPGSSYVVSGNATTTRKHSFTRQVVVPNRPTPAKRFGGPILLGVGLLALVGTTVGKYGGRLDPTPEERAYVGYRGEREEFAEWIHAVSLPAGTTRLSRGEAESLSDLVDLAIDTNGAVLHPPGDDAYYVIDGGFLYVFEPPTLDDGAADNQSDGEVHPDGDGEGDENSEGDEDSSTDESAE